MTLVDEERQDYLIKALPEENTTLKKPLVHILFMPAKYLRMKTVFFCIQSMLVTVKRGPLNLPKQPLPEWLVNLAQDIESFEYDQIIQQFDI